MSCHNYDVIRQTEIYEGGPGLENCVSTAYFSLSNNEYGDDNNNYTKMIVVLYQNKNFF